MGGMVGMLLSTEPMAKQPPPEELEAMVGTGLPTEPAAMGGAEGTFTSVITTADPPPAGLEGTEETELQAEPAAMVGMLQFTQTTLTPPPLLVGLGGTVVP